MLVPPNIHKYRDSSDCINRQTKSPTQLLTNTINFKDLSHFLFLSSFHNIQNFKKCLKPLILLRF